MLSRGDYTFWLGASAEEADPALVASDQAAARLAPTGFDPLRCTHPYSLTRVDTAAGVSWHCKRCGITI